MAEDKEGLIYEPTPTLKQEQKPQAYCDRQGPGYDNDVPINGWLRAKGESAEGKPGFDKLRQGRASK